MIAGLAVTPSAQRKGVASALLEAAEAYASARKVERLTLRVLSVNTAALALYERHGYETEGELRGEFRLPLALAVPWCMSMTCCWRKRCHQRERVYPATRACSVWRREPVCRRLRDAAPDCRWRGRRRRRAQARRADFRSLAGAVDAVRVGPPGRDLSPPRGSSA